MSPNPARLSEALSKRKLALGAICLVCDWQGAKETDAERAEADRVIDWRRPAAAVADQVRALSPEVGAHAELGGRRVLVWKAVPRTSLPSGGDARDRLVVPCGSGYLEIVELQEAGRRRMSAQEYLRGAGRRLAQG